MRRFLPGNKNKYGGKIAKNCSALDQVSRPPMLFALLSAGKVALDRAIMGDEPRIAEPTLGEALRSVARAGLDLSHVLTSATVNHKIQNTNVVAHCHHVALDGSSLPRLQDLSDAIAEWVTDYVIPRSVIEKAEQGADHERRLKLNRLRARAIDTFKTKGMSGEQGELLMFVLAESFLGLPQLLCKMDLKTDSEMHFHGIDGVHCGGAPDDDERLAVYWCESKVHQSLEGALSDAFDGLKPYLLAPGSGQKDKKRELALLDRYMDLGSAAIVERIIGAINPDGPVFNTIHWGALCLIGFDHEYPSKPNQISHAKFLAEIDAAFPGWASKAESRAKNRGLESFEIHIFYMPLGFCEQFREAMKISLGLSSG